MASYKNICSIIREEMAKKQSATLRPDEPGKEKMKITGRPDDAKPDDPDSPLFRNAALKQKNEEVLDEAKEKPAPKKDEKKKEPEKKSPAPKKDEKKPTDSKKEKPTEKDSEQPSSDLIANKPQDTSFQGAKKAKDDHSTTGEEPVKLGGVTPVDLHPETKDKLPGDDGNTTNGSKVSGSKSVKEELILEKKKKWKVWIKMKKDKKLGAKVPTAIFKESDFSAMGSFASVKAKPDTAGTKDERRKPEWHLHAASEYEKAAKKHESAGNHEMSALHRKFRDNALIRYVQMGGDVKKINFSEEVLGEVSTSKLAKYIDKANQSRKQHTNKDVKDPKWLDDMGIRHKRESGLERATKKLRDRHDYGYHEEAALDEGKKTFHVHWITDSNKQSPRPTPIKAHDENEAKETFRKKWPHTKIHKVVVKEETLDEAKHTHEAEFVQSQHGYWGSTPLKTKKLKIKATDDKHAQSQAELHRMKLPYQSLSNGDRKSWSLKSVKPIGEEAQLDELHGKGSLPAIEKSYEGKKDDKSKLNRQRAHRDRIIASKNPKSDTYYNKPVLKQYSKEDSAKAREIRKEDMSWSKIKSQLNEAKGPAKGQDTEGDDHIINQLRKAKNLKNHTITFKDKSKHPVSGDTASKALNHYEGLKSAQDKLHAAARMGGSHQGLHDVISGKKTEAPKSRQQPSMPHGFKPKGLPLYTGGSKGVAPAGGRKAKKLSNIATPKDKYRPD